MGEPGTISKTPLKNIDFDIAIRFRTMHNNHIKYQNILKFLFWGPLSMFDDNIFILTEILSKYTCRSKANFH